MWQVSSIIIDSSLILPSPKETLICLKNILFENSFWSNVGETFLRVIIAFVFTIIFGCGIGILCGKSKFAREYFSVPISILRSTPVVSLILVLIFVFTSKNIPIIVAILMSLPVMISAISNGFELNENDKKLFFMAKVFNFSNFQKIRFLWIPKLKPFFKTGLISSFGMEWKVVTAGEVLSLPKNALGTQLFQSQVHLESSEVLAISIIIIIFSFILESLLKRVFKNGK